MHGHAPRRTRPRRTIVAAALAVLVSALTVLVPMPSAEAVPASSETWNQLSPGTSPGGRYGSMSAYDPATSQFILFGGITTSGTFLNETWSWSGSTWTKLTPANSPSARAYGSMVYDPDIGKLLLFGGGTDSTYTNETWTWSGTNWTQLSPSTSPSVRSSAAMTFDSNLGKVVLFGGQLTSTTFSSETWTFDGSTWASLSTATTGTPPSGRTGAAFAFDPATGNSVLFSGGNASSNAADTWTFANSRWTQLTPSNSPTKGNYLSMAFDPNSGQLILVSSGSTVVWGWNGTTWTALSGGPSARDLSTLAFDPRRGTLVVFGGETGGTVLADTWTFAPIIGARNWSNPTSTGPSNRTDAMSAYDPGTGQFILYGGYDNGRKTDTWSWNGSSWTQLSPTTTPTLSFAGCLTWDDATGQLILFGGVDTAGADSNLTYSWSGTNWIKLTPAASPSPRSSPACGFDAATGQLILFGGASGSTALSDTWSWNGSTWTQLSPATSPPARYSAGFAFDPATNQMILVGGGSGSTPYMNDTWNWTGSTWTQLSPTTSPTAVQGGTSAWNPVLQRIVIVGGQKNSTTDSDETWTWDGVTWTKLTTSVTPGAVSLAVMDFDPRSANMVLFGGWNETSTRSSTWILDVTAAAQPTLTTSSSLTWSSSTLSGYDQHLAATQTIAMPAPTAGNWNISFSANNQLTSGANTLPPVTVNGSSSSFTATTNPSVGCAVAGCTVPTQSGAAGYPVSVPVTSSAVVFGAQGNGSGQLSIPLRVWAHVPATANPGTYSNTITVTTNFGP